MSTTSTPPTPRLLDDLIPFFNRMAVASLLWPIVLPAIVVLTGTDIFALFFAMIVGAIAGISNACLFKLASVVSHSAVNHPTVSWRDVLAYVLALAGVGLTTYALSYVGQFSW